MTPPWVERVDSPLHILAGGTKAESCVSYLWWLVLYTFRRPLDKSVVLWMTRFWN